MQDNQNASQRIVKLVQELLLEELDRAAITPALITAKIEQVAALNPRWQVGIDREAIVDELIRRFSIWIGENTALRNDAGHVPWLNAERKRDWRYWQRYREWLERKLSFKAVEGLDRTTDSILELLEDPKRDGRWDRRGLVVGHVQSGKTSNYTGLICKAADAGYKIIIVLAGLHNNLRSQTQIRLDEGFLGYETSPDPGDIQPTGVGEIDADPAIRPHYVTNRSEKGDFVTSAARNLGIGPEARPWLFVIKKNKTVLDRLYGWIRNHVADLDDQQSGRRIVTKLPLLMIDDESDHASVDTGEQVFNADGEPDEEHQPTAINTRIRRILNSFTRAAYVGYTATPFANIYIHDRGATRLEGADLFPSAFIINLAAPSNYIGPTKVFGTLSAQGRVNGLPLIRTVDKDPDEKASILKWMPAAHKNGWTPRCNGADAPPDSLVEAVDAFILGCVIRRLRGQSSEHCSMLVHVTRFTSVQAHVHRQIESLLLHTRQRLERQIDHEVLISRLQLLWARDFVPTTEGILQRDPDEVRPLPAWSAVEPLLTETVRDIEVRSINGTAKDALDYSRQKNGMKVIAVGGEKLARGLTLEGLTVSYFLRASKMYDTLMQMGRWFGYRPGYLDLSRLYTTTELIDWFAHITDAAEELREEFDLMAASGATPKEYGLRVQSHPVLLVTSPLKMRAAKDLWLSFSGDVLETVALHRDVPTLTRNLQATEALLARLGRPAEADRIVRSRPGRPHEWKGYLWCDADASLIIDFLIAYRTHPEAHKVRSELVAEFVQAMNQVGELTRWTVAFIGGGEGDPHTFGEGLTIKMSERKNTKPYEDRYSIGRLLSPRDEAIDLDEAVWSAALESTRHAWKPNPARGAGQEPPDAPSGAHIRRVRGLGAPGLPASPERGLLLLYALDPKMSGLALPENTPPIMAFGMSFPNSKSIEKVKYTVNTVQWKQWEADYGASD